MGFSVFLLSQGSLLIQTTFSVTWFTVSEASVSNVVITGT